MKFVLYFLVALSIISMTFGRPQDSVVEEPRKDVKKVEGKSEDLRTASSYGFGYGLGFGYPYGYYGFYGPGYGYGYGYPYYGYYGAYGYPFYG